MTDLQPHSESVIARQTLKKKKSVTLSSLNQVQVNLRGTIILADMSGSMAGTKIQELKKALTTVWSPGIEGIAFSSELYELTESDILHMDASGTTAMHEALQEAWSRNPQHIILMTDGWPDGNPQDVLASVRAHTQTPIDTVGIGDCTGSGYDEGFLKEIAELTGGRFTDVSEPIKLTSTLQFLIEYKPDSLLTEPTHGNGSVIEL